MNLIAEYGQVLIILACCFGFFMAWGMGANDVANAMGTSVGSKALTITQALIIAAVFEFAGAYLAGGEVTSTISKGIVDVNLISPDTIVLGMLASTLASGVWLFLASINGWPVSATHTIVGAIIGFAAVGVGVDSVYWGSISAIAASWVTSPLLAAVIAFIIFKSVQKLILSADDPYAMARKYVPYYMFYAGFFVTMLVMMKGVKHVGIELEVWQSLVISLVWAAVVTIFGKILLVRLKPENNENSRFAGVERIFAVLMIFSACAMAFAHGSNDVANAIGPLAAIVEAVQKGRGLAEQSSIPSWTLLLGAVGIVIGLITLGYRVIATLGKKITELTPSRGFAAELSAASTVVLGSALGIPLSTTHTLVGAVLGVGLARGIGAIDMRVIGAIFTTWVITLPAGAIFSIMFFYMLKGIFLG